MQEKTIGNCHVVLFPKGNGTVTGFIVTPPNGDTRTGTKITYEKAVTAAEDIARRATFDVILTRGDGTPIERPTPLGKDASTGEGYIKNLRSMNADEYIEHMRAVHDYQDEVADVANAAFTSTFASKVQS